MREIVVVTAGTRGDVQPYVALGMALQKVGVRVRVITHPDFKEMVEEAGLAFGSLGLSIRAMVDSPEGQAFLRTAGHPVALIQGILRAFLQHADRVMDHLLTGCEGATAVIFSGLGFPAYHIAEARNIPAIAAYLQPLTPTRAFPAPVGLIPRWLQRGWFNRLTYHLAEYGAWWMVRGPSNRFRRRLGLHPLGFRGPFPAIHAGRVLHLYAFSAHLVPRPPDWPAWARITGYWFRPTPDDTPPEKLAAFLDHHHPVVYIGFGSLRFPAPERILDLLMQVLEHLDLYAVIARGWSGFPPVPHPRIHWVEAVPHEWLFPRVDAVVHHGGAGTTAMGLRFGKPTLILPFLADQFFWGERVEAVGAGRMLAGRAARDFGYLRQAFRQILEDPEIHENAAQIGRKIQQEQGIDHAVKEILLWIGG